MIVSPTLMTTMYANDFEKCAGDWTFSGLGFWNLTADGSTVYSQSSVAGEARASACVPADDQVVRVRARLDTFGSPTGTQERWFGVMARHVDDRNYYLLALGSSNTVSLRKVVNGTPTTLASAAFPVLPASWYQLRLDAVGDLLRAYVNGTLLLETTDGALPEGGGWRREEPDRQTGQDNEVAHRLSEACNWRPRSPHGIARVSWTDDGVSRRRPPNPARISPWWRSGASSERG